MLISGIVLNVEKPLVLTQTDCIFCYFCIYIYVCQKP
jgi:hypothetical protein